MIGVSQTTRALANRAAQGSDPTGPPLPSEEQIETSNLRQQNIDVIFQEGCARCCQRKLQRPRIPNMDGGQLTCPLFTHAYTGQLTPEEVKVAAECGMPDLFRRAWDHEAGEVTGDQVADLRPDWDAVAAREAREAEGVAPAPAATKTRKTAKERG